MRESYLAKLSSIKALVFDVDGVFTDGSIILLPGGEMARTMNTRDGFSVKKATDHGIPVAIITGGKSEMVKKRFENLGVKHVYLGVQDKIESLKEFCEIYKLELSDILFMGDDLPDFECMKRVGLPCCPYDSVPEIIEISTYISPLKGGQGCVRDIIEQYLKLKQMWLRKEENDNGFVW